MQTPNSKPVILFDGVCNLCNSSVQFIIKNDPKGRFQFAALQSPFGEKVKEENQLEGKELESVLLVQPSGKVLSRSTAALSIAKGLRGLWPMMFAFIIIPPFLRNAVYDFIARNRYKWFGKQESCMFPTPEIKSRFVDLPKAGS